MHTPKAREKEVSQILTKINDCCEKIKQVCIYLINNSNYFKSFGNNYAYKNSFEQYDANINEIIDYMDQLDIEYNREHLVMAIPNEYYVEYDNIIAKALEIFNNKKVKDNGLHAKLTNECAMAIWMQGNELITVLDIGDFYRGFKEFVERVEKFKLDDDIHKNKIQFYIDSQKQNSIQPQDLNDFFDICWTNPKDREQMLSSEPFNDEQVASNDKLVLEVLKKTQESDFYLGQKFIINQKGYDDPSNHNYIGQGIVRFGRHATQSPVPNDIYFSTKEGYVSRRQFYIKYLSLESFCICCTSTTNPTEFLLQKEGWHLKEGSVFALADKISFVVTELYADEQEYIQQPQNENETLRMKKLAKKNIVNLANDDQLDHIQEVYQENKKNENFTWKAVQNNRQKPEEERKIVEKSDEEEEEGQGTMVAKNFMKQGSSNILNIENSDKNNIEEEQKYNQQDDSENTISNMMKVKKFDVISNNNNNIYETPEQTIEQTEVPVDNEQTCTYDPKKQFLANTEKPDELKQQDNNNNIFGQTQNLPKMNAKVNNLVIDSEHTQYRHGKKANQQKQQQQQPYIKIEIDWSEINGIEEGQWDFQVDSHQKIIKIGSKSDNDITIKNGDVDYYHCQIIYENGRWILKEMAIPNQQRISRKGTTISLKLKDEIQDNRPSKNYKIKNNTIIVIAGDRLKATLE